MKVYVLTDTEAGWDCVRGVFTSKDKVADYFNPRLPEDKVPFSGDTIELWINENGYALHEEELQ